MRRRLCDSFLHQFKRCHFAVILVEQPSIPLIKVTFVCFDRSSFCNSCNPKPYSNLLLSIALREQIFLDFLTRRQAKNFGFQPHCWEMTHNGLLKQCSYLVNSEADMSYYCKIGPFISRVYTSLDKIELFLCYPSQKIAFYVKKHSCGFEKVNKGIIAIRGTFCKRVRVFGNQVFSICKIFIIRISTCDKRVRQCRYYK